MLFLFSVVSLVALASPYCPCLDVDVHAFYPRELDLPFGSIDWRSADVVERPAPIVVHEVLRVAPTGAPVDVDVVTLTTEARAARAHVALDLSAR